MSLLVAAQTEITLSGELPVDGIKSRIALRLQRVEALLARRMARGTGVLASIGSCAPFIGLFGTVWGIMDSFVGISRMQTTNLAVVAPGIAEALLATACGLVAAIPAVVIYNIFARVVAGYRLLLGDLSTAVLALASRDLDRASLEAPATCASGPDCATRRSSAMSLEMGSDELEEAHDINVTPFIDVMLVLLIIFMVAAPLATVDVKVDLPASTAAAEPRPDGRLYLTLQADLTLRAGDTPVSADALAAALDQASGGDKGQRVFLRADKAVSYGDLMQAMDDLRAAGYLKVALVGLERPSAQ